MPKTPLVLALLSLTAGCTTISPMALRQADLPAARAGQLIQTWQSAVNQVNGFLVEAKNPDLHQYSLELATEGMVLHLGDSSQGFAVQCTPWGSLVESAGFEAQERSWGFVVGARAEGPPVAANSFFLTADGEDRPSREMAGLILHEAVHTWTDLGTVGFFRGLQYYWYAIFHGGSATHPHERAPYQIETEFYRWHDRRKALGQPVENLGKGGA
jgi:hypothetical protein